MRAETRLRLSFPRLPEGRALPPLPVVVFVVALALVAGAAVASLVSLRDPGLAAIVGVAGLAGVAGAAVAYYAGARDGGVPEWDSASQSPYSTMPAEMERARVAQDKHRAASKRTRGPIRVQSLPVAELPPAYLAAVRKGAAANRAALKARSEHRP